MSTPTRKLQTPSTPLSTGVTRTAWLADANVANQHIRADFIVERFKTAKLVIAHNATFDRRIVERPWPRLPSRSWTCSTSESDWLARNAAGRRLGDRPMLHDMFYSGRRSILNSLALLTAARRTSTIILAADTSFAASRILNCRGSRRSPDPKGSWRSTTLDNDTIEELADLRAVVYRASRRQPPIAMLDAGDNFRPLRHLANRFVQASAVLHIQAPTATENKSSNGSPIFRTSCLTSMSPVFAPTRART